MSDVKIPRAEYPRPQFIRKDWLTLNGEWEYATDRGISGLSRGFQNAESFPERIIVPFCRESKLSGIGDLDFCECCWYRRELCIPKEWRGDRVILNVGACDYRTTVFVNGKQIGEHVGGFVSFSFDITDALNYENDAVIIRAYDACRSMKQAGGKQSRRYESHGCDYRRTTGIWQSVWVERVPQGYIKSAKYYPNINSQSLTVVARVIGGEGQVLRAEASYGGKPMGSAEGTVCAGQAHIVIPLSELHLWEVGQGRLYDLKLTLGGDEVESYFGMRSVHTKDGVLYINGKAVFQRLVLDQGFYPDGILTAQTEAELFGDIDLSMAMGFNGARLHQKIFEPQFLSQCDRRGYIVWGEHGNWGMDISKGDRYINFSSEWIEAVERDFNHPAIIGWCPLNETQNDQDPDFLRALAKLTRELDPTRAYIDTSGYVHVESEYTDFVDTHDYDQNPVTLKERYDRFATGEAISMHRKNWIYKNPTFVSEYGGIRRGNEGTGWGYGETPEDDKAFLERLDGLTRVLCEDKKISAFCYTQLTDVEQELNGVYTFDRKPKFPPEVISKIFGQTAYIGDEKID